MRLLGTYFFTVDGNTQMILELKNYYIFADAVVTSLFVLFCSCEVQSLIHNPDSSSLKVT